MPYTVAFFGATGGCTNACLTHLLLNNTDTEYKAVALARNPQKLVDSLKKQPGITESIIAQKLSIVQGDATDSADVKKTLLCQGKRSIVNNTNTENDLSSPVLVDAIISGIGGAPVRQKGTLMTFKMDNPQITEQFATALVTALREIYVEYNPTHKPVVAVISTTGLSSPEGAKQDVPFGLRTLYYYLLALPHKDKKRMEETLTAANEQKSQAIFKGVVILRPTLLMGDGIISSINDSKKKKTVRAGTEFAPVTGYIIARSDVGEWIWKNILEDQGEKWYGKRVSLAY